MAATRRPKAAPDFIEAMQKEMRQIGVGQIATVSGRYYAMDRDKRWDRIERAFNAMVLGQRRKIRRSGGRGEAIL